MYGFIIFQCMKLIQNEIIVSCNGPVNAQLISWPIKAKQQNKKNIKNLENIWYTNDLDLQYSNSFKNSISCLHLPSFRSLAA